MYNITELINDLRKEVTPEGQEILDKLIDELLREINKAIMSLEKVK